MDFKNDIGLLIPLIGEAVDGAAYNPVSNIVGFHDGDFRIVLGENYMNIYGTDDESVIAGVIDRIIDKISANR